MKILQSYVCELCNTAYDSPDKASTCEERGRPPLLPKGTLLPRILQDAEPEALWLTADSTPRAHGIRTKGIGTWGASLIAWDTVVFLHTLPPPVQPVERIFPLLRRLCLFHVQHAPALPCPPPVWIWASFGGPCTLVPFVAWASFHKGALQDYLDTLPAHEAPLVLPEWRRPLPPPGRIAGGQSFGQSIGSPTGWWTAQGEVRTWHRPEGGCGLVLFDPVDQTTRDVLDPTDGGVALGETRDLVLSLIPQVLPQAVRCPVETDPHLPF